MRAVNRRGVPRSEIGTQCHDIGAIARRRRYSKSGRHGTRRAHIPPAANPLDSRETPIRLPILPLTTAICALACPALAYPALAQSSHGSIGVSAVILAPVPAATVFVRVSTGGEKDGTHPFVAQPRTQARSVHPPAVVGRDSTIRIERLITAGT